MIRQIPWRVKPPLGIRQNPSHPLSYGLMGHWLMNEAGGLTAYDISGNGNHGTLTNGPTWTQGQFGPALSFDGLDDRVTLPDMGTAESYPFTFSAWFNTSAADATQAVVSQTNSADSAQRAQLTYADTVTNFCWNVRNGASEAEACTSITQDGAWHHAVGVSLSATDHKLYVDGVLKTSNTNSVSAPAVDTTTIGDNPKIVFPWNGRIDDVRIYNRALSAGEISYLYVYPFADLIARRQILVMPPVAAGRIFKLAGRGGGLAGPSIGLAG